MTKILITENDIDVKFLLSSILKDRYSLLFISSGEQILQGLYEKPDLFILSSKLPDVGMNEQKTFLF